ncbi:hypothetical protein AcV5_009407 [Taiwanofungus camphoratus]|nr:hypothetical protein AcV5_009407 [Antrodia cinnamomea]
MCDLLPLNVTVGKPEQEIENSDQAASPANRSFDKLHDHAGHNSSAHRNNQKGKITHGHRSDMRESSLLFLLAFPSIPGPQHQHAAHQYVTYNWTRRPHLIYRLTCSMQLSGP